MNSITKNIRDEAVPFESHGVTLARVTSSSTTRIATISISASPEIYLKKELDINQPFIIYVPYYGAKEVKLIKVGGYDVDVEVKSAPFPLDFKSFQSVDNSPISEQEKVVISGKLDELVSDASQKTEAKKDSPEYAEYKAALDDLVDGVEYIKTSMNHMGRKDFLGLSLNVFTSLVVGGVYAPDVAMEYGTQIMTAIPQVFSSMPSFYPSVNTGLSMLCGNS